jgi:exodeoxyribonuclease X
MIIRCIDFEATGLPTKDTTEAVCEVGWCDVVFFRDDAEVLKPQSVLVNPGRPIPPAASAIHHILDRDVADCPPPTAAMAALMEGADAFCAHNIDHEQEYFGGGDKPWLCTYKAALRVWPDAPGHKLQELRYWLKLDDEPDFDRALSFPPHRAAADAFVSAFVLRKLLGLASFDDIARWSKGPALLYMCFFKKYRNVPWHEVPSDYMQWVIDKAEQADRDVKATCRHWLRKRAADAGQKDISNVE